MSATGNQQDYQTFSLNVEGLNSPQDADILRQKVKSLEGVVSFNINMDSKKAVITFDQSTTSSKEIVRSVSETGMTCSAIKDSNRSTWWKDRQQLALYACGIITLFAFVLIVVGVETMVTNIVFLIAVLVGVYYPARKAIIALITFSPLRWL